MFLTEYPTEFTRSYSGALFSSGLCSDTIVKIEWRINPKIKKNRISMLLQSPPQNIFFLQEVQFCSSEGVTGTSVADVDEFSGSANGSSGRVDLITANISCL